MKRNIEKAGINFYIGNYTPRKNDYEKGLKYKLYVDDIPTGNVFSTIKDAKKWINENYFIYL